MPELSDTLEPRKVAAVLAAVIVAVATAAALAYALDRWFTDRRPPHRAVEARPGPPHLLARPAEQSARLLDDKKARLHSYGWIDREAGIVHIPIEEAMERTAREMEWKPQQAESSAR